MKEPQVCSRTFYSPISNDEKRKILEKFPDTIFIERELTKDEVEVIYNGLEGLQYQFNK